MRSMTGFGQGQGASSRLAVTVSLRSVNGRFLDLVLKLREELKPAEAAVREVLSSLLTRGRVEAAIEARALTAAPVEFAVREELLRSLFAATASLSREGMVEQRLTLGDLIRVPELLEIRAGAQGLAEEDITLLTDVTRQAAADLLRSRAAEGAKLAAVLGARLGELKAIARRLEPLAATAQREAAAALRLRLAELAAEVPLDEARLAQEVAILADRSDVREELDRLESHLQHFAEILATDGATGKRLDFLVQEILRELNTIGSKARSADLVPLLLDAKVLTEQLREQVQNLE